MRVPLTILAVALELALILAGSGVPPSRLWRGWPLRRMRSIWGLVLYSPVASSSTP
jgi:hypothetical protein